MAAFDGLDRVIRIGSFSESPAAAVRCGNIATRHDWIEALADLLHGVLTDGSYRRHVETVRTRLTRATARAPVGDDAVVLARMGAVGGYRAGARQRLQHRWRMGRSSSLQRRDV